jgi:GTP-binding protein
LTIPMVAIVGRPNVGKSTLFNRLIGERKAIEEKIPGVTRDRVYGRATWLNTEFLVIDTGGITFSETMELERLVQKQALLAMEEATVIVFLIDGREGITALDEEIATLLHRQGRPVVLAANKVEARGIGLEDFYRLGFGEAIPVSATHGLNIGDFLDRVVSFFPAPDERPEVDMETIRIAVVGRPNVGKSSFINVLLGEERSIVSTIPGTTRDAVDITLEQNGKSFIFVDTAGIRRKSKVKEDIEYYSVLRALKAIDSADIVLLLLEATEGVTEQDQKIAGYIQESGKAVIIALNKWDLLKDSGREKAAVTQVENVRENLKFFAYAPVVFTSIHEPRRLKRLFTLFEEVYGEYTKRISTPLLNHLLSDAVKMNPLPASGKRKARIYYWTQPVIKPPTFILFVNDPLSIHFSYLRYLENRLREAFGFQGSPLRLTVRGRSKKGVKRS